MGAICVVSQFLPSVCFQDSVQRRAKPFPTPRDGLLGSTHWYDFADTHENMTVGKPFQIRIPFPTQNRSCDSVRERRHIQSPLRGAEPTMAGTS